jgi:ankyrin repeat protein
MRAGCLVFLASLLQGDEIYTALGIAANSGNADIATMLVKAGADADHQDSQVILLVLFCSLSFSAPLLLSVRFKKYGAPSLVACVG